MEERNMTEGRQTRMESHCEIIEEFLRNDVKSIRRRLYSREIRNLRKKFPKIEIQVESYYKDSLYNCLISKKS